MAFNFPLPIVDCIKVLIQGIGRKKLQIRIELRGGLKHAHALNIDFEKHRKFQRTFPSQGLISHTKDFLCFDVFWRFLNLKEKFNI